MPGFILGGGSPSPYLIPNSIRTLRYTNGGYLSRTPASSGSLTTWTVSTWFKPARENNFGGNGYDTVVLGANYIDQIVYSGPAAEGGNGGSVGVHGNGGSIVVYGGLPNYTDNVGHTHLIIAFDSTQAVSTNRIRIWANGVETTGLLGSYPSLNATMSINQGTVAQYIGNSPYTGDYDGIHDAIFSDYRFFDGQYLTNPYAFGKFDSLGAWIPVKYTGAALTGNSFYLQFQNPSNLGADSSGLGNTWSLTTLTSSDQLTDTPTSNTCTFARDWPGMGGGVLTYCGLQTSGLGVGSFNAMAIPAYWEITANAAGLTAGVISQTGATNTTALSSGTTYGFRLSAGGVLEYTTNGSSWNNIASGLSGIQFPYSTGGSSTANFGQKPLAFAAPTGYKTLTTANLPGASGLASGSFLGNASSDGPYVWMAGSPTSLTINGNAVTFGTHAIKRCSGVKIITSSASYNASGVNTWTATYGIPFNGAHASPSQGDA